VAHQNNLRHCSLFLKTLIQFNIIKSLPMKLFLTSSGLSDENEKDFLDLLSCDPKGLRVAFIPTAMNQESEEVKKKYISIDVNDLENLGMKVEFINLEKLNEENIIEIFKPFDVIYVYGGNTFYLMYHIKRSGFKKNIIEIIKNKVYFGVSAGSIVTGKDISIAGWENGDLNNINLKDVGGLGLVDFSILPHWDGKIPTEAEDYRYEIKYIKDGEAIVVDK
jgi:dipeptidase E